MSIFGRTSFFNKNDSNKFIVKTGVNINKIICTKNNFGYLEKEIDDGIIMIPFENIISYLRDVII